MNQSQSKSPGKKTTKKAVAKVEIPYKPRPYQLSVHNSLKTAADKPRSLCAFIAPTYRQGKSIAW